MQRKFFLFTFLLVFGFLFAGQEDQIVSLAGTLNRPIKYQAIGNSLFIRDQWFDDITGTASNCNNSNIPYCNSNYIIKSASSRVVLRFADTKRKAFGADKWGIQVTYDISWFDFAGTIHTVTGEVREINFHPTDPYTDISLKDYPGSIGANVRITCVKYYRCLATNSCTFPVNCDNGANPLPADLSDVYFDLEQHTDRYFNISCNQTAPEIHFLNTTQPNTKNELELTWNHIPGAENYDLEWLFIDVPDAPNPITDKNFDFRNATRINTPDNFYNIPLAYPSGILLYRVRAVWDSVYYDATLSQVVKRRTERRWSTFSTGQGIPINTGNTSSYTADQKWRINVSPLHSGLNWQYAATYAEDGKHKEVISFFDGSLRNRQTVTQVNTDNNVIVAETKYDYQGRGAVQIMPTPLTNTAGVHYYNNFCSGFNKSSFDTDAKVNNPDGLGTLDQANLYYGANTSATGFDAYVPTAGGFAYSRTWFKNDGSNRLKKQSGVGTTHKMGSGHEVSYFYGSPDSQDQIDALFGNDVGNVSHYQKNMVVDANGQATISYLDQEGRTIATALAGDGSNTNLLPVDGIPANFPSVTSNTFGHE
jgi:hypothetical protein